MSETQHEEPEQEAAEHEAHIEGDDGDETTPADEDPDRDPNEAPQPPEPSAPIEPGPDEDGQTPAPPNEPQGLTPEQLEKRSKSAETRFATYARGIRGLYEDEEENLVECPLCPPQHKGFVDVRFAGHIPEEVADAVKFYLGVARQVEYPQDPGANTCPMCDGYGKVTTGSRVPGHETRTCTNCTGYGYMPPPGRVQKPSENGHGDLVAVELTEPTLPDEDRDPWGEPRILPDGRENPNYGKQPQYKIMVEPWGVTAGLSAQSVAA